jgi:hypothetical protein
MSREQRIAQAQQEGTFGAIRDQYNQVAKSAGKQMDEAGNIQTLAPYRPGLTSPTVQSQMDNRAALEDRASGLRLLREMSQTPLQVDKQTERIGGKTYGSTDIQGKYGSGFSYTAPAGTKRPEGYEGNIGGRPFSEVMRGLANKQAREGTWREGDRLPEGMTKEQALAESEKNRQNRQSLQRLNKR